MSKRMWLIGLAALVLMFSSLACDGGDGLVENMKDAGEGGQEALDRLDETAEDLMSPEPIRYPDDEKLEEVLEVIGDAVEEAIESSNELDAEIALTVCIAGCDALYGPMAPVLSDTEVMSACVANCQQ